MQGANPVELNSSNFNFYTEESTAGANCLDCQSNVPVPPPPPTPPAQTCFQVTLVKAAAPLDLCSGVTRTVDLNASSLPAASVVYSDDTCTSLFPVDQYFAETSGSDYYFWNSSAATLTGPYTQNCP